MLPRPLLLLLLVLAADFTAAKTIFQISAKDLKRTTEWDGGPLQQQLLQVLQHDGALAVTGLGESYERAVKGLKAGAPDCLAELSTPTFELGDGSLRTTLAMMGEGHLYPPCLAQQASVIRDQFDVVFGLVSTIFEHVAGGAENLEWLAQPTADPQPFSGLLIKEHLHVYHAPQQERRETFAQPFHTDNGLLLLLTPFMEHPVKIKSRLHENIDTSEVTDDSILLIVARALPSWLLQGSEQADRFFPAPHAVPSLPPHTSPRTVLARMMVAPMAAVPARAGSGRTFQDIFLNQDPDQLCPPAQFSDPSGWQVGQEQACPEGSAYCWMTCLILPSCPPGQEAVCNNLGGETCCTETILQDCQDMDGTCEWRCQ